MELSEQITKNKRKSFVLFCAFILIYLAIGWAISYLYGEVALVIAALIAVGMTLAALFFGDDMAVALAGGRRVEERSQAPELWDAVETMSLAAGLPKMPRVYIAMDDSPNAFAAGRTHEQAIVCANVGLLRALDKEELEGVIAHEIAHVRNYDVRLMTYAAVLAGSLGLISELGLRLGLFGGGRREGQNPIMVVVALVTLILAPIAALLIQMAISRRREFLADAMAAELTRYPQGLSSALRAIAGPAQGSKNSSTIAHMYIVPGAFGALGRLFATHPPTEERLAALDTLSGGIQHSHSKREYSQAMAGIVGAEPQY